MNRTAKGISLKGWSILNKSGAAHGVSGDIWLAPGELRSVTLGAVPLSNKGGLLTLLDEKGHKVDGVGYTPKMAEKEGELVIFR